VPEVPGLPVQTPQTPEVGKEVARALAYLYAELALVYDRMCRQGGSDAPHYRIRADHAQTMARLYQQRLAGLEQAGNHAELSPRETA
jgi:hypothetical protein